MLILLPLCINGCYHSSAMKKRTEGDGQKLLGIKAEKTLPCFALLRVLKFVEFPHYHFCNCITRITNPTNKGARAIASFNLAPDSSTLLVKQIVKGKRKSNRVHSTTNMTTINSCSMFFLCFFIMPIVVFSDVGPQSGPSTQILQSLYEDKNGSKTVSVKAEHAYVASRKFLQHGIGTCTKKDISISQSKDTATGIPQYIVQIVNTCVSGCAPHGIHLHCGWFASARVINPRVFKRLAFDDCLVNGGSTLATGQIIRFTYSNSFMYPLAFKSAKFC